MFNVTKWAQANGLEPPVTGTYFEAEFDGEFFQCSGFMR
jgi:hypothetical protein